MKKEFIPYEQALELKELGFNEPCFGRWLVITEWDIPTGEIILQIGAKAEDYDKKQCNAPTFSQAFRWFRNKGYRNIISSDYKNMIYYFDVWKGNQFMFETKYIYNTYEEAELACLKKLIEIVKSKS